MRDAHATPEWSRNRLLLVLACIVATAVLLIVGLAYAFVAGFKTNHDPSSDPQPVSATQWETNSDGLRGDHYRDALSAEPMLATTQRDLEPAAPALTPGEPIRIPAATDSGPGGVGSGFPQTPEGAVGQLAAIEVSVLAPMSLQYARNVFDDWAEPGADFGNWELAAAIQSFHANAGTIDGDGSVLLTASPVGAQVKGTDGPSWVVVCVQMDVNVSVVESTRFGYGHCERMVWTSDRWMIEASTPPASAPSTWPGSTRSVDAGWLAWESADTAAGTD